MKKKEKKNSKFLQIAAVALFILLVIQVSRQPLQSQKNLPPANKEKAGGEKIEISGVSVNDFFKQLPEGASKDYVSIALVQNYYHVFYFAPDQLFTISIQRSPFDEMREIAEQEFLKSLDVSEENACKLNVQITTPLYANPGKAGQSYRLSFCE